MISVSYEIIVIGQLKKENSMKNLQKTGSLVFVDFH